MCTSVSLSVSAQEDWADYVTVKDHKVMSISLDLSLDLNRPNYQYLLVVGGRFRDCMQNGFPGDSGLSEIFALSDSVASTLERKTRIRLAGFITYQCMAFDVFYAKDTIGLRDALSDMVSDHFRDKSLYLDIKSDKGWLYYKSFLYPGSFSSEFLIDQEYLTDLVLQGDDLQEPRRIYHWFYFKTLKKRKSMSAKLKQLNFSLDSIAYVRERFNPYQLTVSRKDSVGMIIIN